MTFRRAIKYASALNRECPPINCYLAYETAANAVEITETAILVVDFVLTCAASAVVLGPLDIEDYHNFERTAWWADTPGKAWALLDNQSKAIYHNIRDGGVGCSVEPCRPLASREHGNVAEVASITAHHVDLELREGGRKR